MFQDYRKQVKIIFNNLAQLVSFYFQLFCNCMIFLLLKSKSELILAFLFLLFDRIQTW